MNDIPTIITRPEKLTDSVLLCYHYSSLSGMVDDLVLFAWQTDYVPETRIHSEIRVITKFGMFHDVRSGILVQLTILLVFVPLSLIFTVGKYFP